MQSRLGLVKKIARKNRCTHVFVTDSIDAEYISGFRSSNVSLLIGSRTCHLCTDFRYRESALRFCRANPQWRFFEITESSFSFLKSLLLRGDRLGIESNSVTLDQRDKIAKNCRGVKLVRLHDEVTAVSMVKSDGEIAAIKKAARICDRAFAGILPYLRPGRTELEVASALEGLCTQFGSEKPSFDTIVLCGRHSALPHGRPSTARIQKSDWVLMDFGCMVDGFCSDISRTVVMGRASDGQRRVYAIVREAQQRARRAAVEGARCCDVDAVARTLIDEKGYGGEFGHATGHGLGLRIHEKPRIGKSDTTPLAKGMVFTIEPGIYLPRRGGVRIEDTMALDGDGAVPLTHSPRHLIEIGL
jgi:Xaa-Pro aminopeptidase